jgi:hypothetical protein
LNTAPTPVITPHPTSAGRAVERNVVVDLHDRVFVHQHLLAERGQVESLVHVLAALPGHAAGLSWHHLDFGVLAQIGVAGDALRAGAAEH